MRLKLDENLGKRARGTAISLVFDSSRYVAGFGPLLAGWLITNLGGIATAATIVGTIYILGLVVTPSSDQKQKASPCQRRSSTRSSPSVTPAEKRVIVILNTVKDHSLDTDPSLRSG